MAKQDKITEIKVKLYDVIEQQAVLQAEFNRLEQIKSELAKELGNERKAAQETEAAAKKAETDD